MMVAIHTTTLIIKLVIINKHKDGIGSEIVGKSSDIIVRKTVSAIPIWIKRLYFIRNSRTSSMEQMNNNKKNEYYSSEDTVKVKIGEKLTWKRVVAFFDRCLLGFFFIISFITYEISKSRGGVCMCIFKMCFQQSSECSLQNIYRLSEVSNGH
jgi:hypothetical protein